MDTEQKLKLIENIINDTDLRSHNKVTDISMLFDFWNHGKWDGIEERVRERYFKEE